MEESKSIYMILVYDGRFLKEKAIRQARLLYESPKTPDDLDLPDKYNALVKSYVLRRSKSGSARIIKRTL